MTTTEDTRPVRDRSRLWIAGAAVGAVGAVGAVALWAAGDGRPAWPAGVTEAGGGIPVGASDAVVVDAWFDFDCPTCADASAELAPTIDALLDADEITLVYHPLSFVTPVGSAAAANALGCAADQGRAREFHDVVLARDAAADELNADLLVSLGAEAGIENAAFATCVAEDTYAEWVQAVNDSAQSVGIAVTPTYLVDGEQVVLSGSPSRALADAVAAAGDDSQG